MRLATSGHDAVDGSSTGTSVPWMWALLRLPRFRGASHADDNDIGLDIAKSVFQVHGVDAGGQVIVRRQLKRVLSWLSFRAATMPGWHRGLRLISPLVARTPGTRSYRSADAAGYVKPTSSGRE